MDFDTSVRTFFNTSTETKYDIDALFFQHINSPKIKRVPLNLIMKYNTSFHPKFKDILLSYIKLTLTSYLTNECGDPTILLPYLKDTLSTQYEHFTTVIADLDIFIHTKCDSIDDSLFLIFLVYKISHEMSTMSLFDNFHPLLSALNFLCGLCCVKELLKSRLFWGLSIETESDKDLEKSFMSFCIDHNNFRPHRSFCSGNMLKSLVLHFNRFVFENNHSINPLTSSLYYNSNTSVPFFLEGCFEPFLYTRTEDFSQLLKNEPPHSLREKFFSAEMCFREISTKLHKTLLEIIKTSAECKQNFLDCILYTFCHSLNQEKRKIKYDKDLSGSDGFFVNFGNVLRVFCGKIVNNPSMFDKIDFQYVNKISKFLDKIENDKKSAINNLKNLYILNSNRYGHINTINNDLDTIFNNKVDDFIEVSPGYNEFVTKIFTFSVLYLGLGYVKMIEDYKNYDAFSEEDEEDDFRSRLNAYHIVLTGDTFTNLKDLIEFCMVSAIKYEDNCEKNFFDDKFVEMKLKNLELTSDESFLTQDSQNKSVEKNSKEDDFKSNNQVTSFISDKNERETAESDNNIIEKSNITQKEILKTIKPCNNGMFLDNIFYEPLITIQSFCCATLKSQISPNQYILIEKMFNSKMNLHEKEKILKLLINTNKKISNKMFIQILNFYVESDKSESFEKYNTKRTINVILYQDKSRNFEKIKRNGLKYVCSVIKDLEKALGDGLDSILKIKNCMNEIKEMEIKFEKENRDISQIGLDKTREPTEEEKLYIKKKSKINRYTAQARGSFEFASITFTLLEKITKMNIGLIEYPETKQFLLNTLNYNLKLLVGPKCSSFSIENMEKYYFKPREILFSLLCIYSQFTKEMQKEVVYTVNFNINYFKRGCKIVSEKMYSSQENKEKLYKFVDQLDLVLLEKMEKQKEEGNDDFCELSYPDEFLDDLTFEPMKNPVILKSSKKIIDKSTFDMIMVCDGIDPFNREKIDEASFEVDEDLKKKIREFEESRKSGS